MKTVPIEATGLYWSVLVDHVTFILIIPNKSNISKDVIQVFIETHICYADL